MPAREPHQSAGSMDAVRPCVVLDIDGVLADVRHRLRFIAAAPKDWDGFFAAASEDEPLATGVDFARTAATSHDIVYLTGRPERTRADTTAWLARHGLPNGQLVMRRDNDRRPAVLTKTQALRMLSRERRIDLMVDDDPRVTEAVERAGFPIRLADWMPRSDTLTDAQGRDGQS